MIRSNLVLSSHLLKRLLSLNFIFRNGLVFLLSLFFVGIHSVSAKDFEVPSLRSPVQDSQDFISSDFASKLSNKLREIKTSGGPQIQVLIIPDLQDYTIEEASIKIMDDWKLGDAKRDDGVLILIAKKERKVRIEVGQGLEGALPDIEAKHIIEDLIVPQFKNGNREQGILSAVQSVLSRVRNEYPENSEFRKLLDSSSRATDESGASEQSPPVGPNLLVFIFILIFIFIRIFFGGFHGPRGGSGTFYGGGGGWGGGRSGGWSGGGGGFSGGGASGDW